LACINLRKIL